MSVITLTCKQSSCRRTIVYEYKGWGRKRSYCSAACARCAKKDQDRSRNRHGERQRIHANRTARKHRNALREISDYEIDAEGLAVQGRESSLQAGPVGPCEGSTSASIPTPDISDHEWFKNNPDWDKDL